MKTFYLLRCNSGTCTARMQENPDGGEWVSRAEAQAQIIGATGSQMLKLAGGIAGTVDPRDKRIAELEQALKDLLERMHRYEMDVDELAPEEHRLAMERARKALGEG